MEYMTLRAAKDHERHSTEHTKRVKEAGKPLWQCSTPEAVAWSVPLPLTIAELKQRESRVHVDHVQDLVPFWIKAVKAAEKGEVLRLEAFLETLQEASDSWGVSTAWEQTGDGWGDGWGDKWSGIGAMWGVDVDGDGEGGLKDRYEFVEDIARQEAADEERRRRMHSFFDVSRWYTLCCH